MHVVAKRPPARREIPSLAGIVDVRYKILSDKSSITAYTDLWLCGSWLSNDYRLRAEAANDTEVAERKMEAELDR